MIAPNPPDAVALPRSEDELEAALAWCDSAGHAAMPYGGATSVVWGVNAPADAETAVTIDVEFVQTKRRDRERTAKTPHGRVDIPQLDTLRFQGAVFVPLGKTIVAGAGGEGAKRRVLLLTPTLVRADG